MSTRGTIKFYIAYNKDIGVKQFYLALCNHWNSEPEYLGKTIETFLRHINIVYGIKHGAKQFEVANGFDDLALQFAIYLKGNDVGNVYATVENAQEEWNYTITYYVKDKSYEIHVDSCGVDNFNGSLDKFGKWLDRYID